MNWIAAYLPQLIYWAVTGALAAVCGAMGRQINKARRGVNNMPTEIIVALLSLLGTACGSIVGIMTSNKLTTYRIARLEEKVDKHNQVIDRVYKIEQRNAVIDEDIKVANHRISDLENKVEKKE